MKSAIIIIISLIVSVCVWGQVNNPPLKISHLTGDFYVFTTYGAYKGSLVPANGLYLVTEAGAVLIDSPWDTTQFQPLLDSIKIKHNKDVVMCIATHSHEDRTGGLGFLKQKGVKTYTTKKTDEISMLTKAKRAEFLIENDTVFTIGHHSFQTCYAGPGHSADNIVIWFDKEKILYGGCLVKSVEATDLGNLGDANINEWEHTIKRIQDRFKRPVFIIPGHQDWTSTQSLHHTLGLIRAYKRAKR